MDTCDTHVGRIRGYVITDGSSKMPCSPAAASRRGKAEGRFIEIAEIIAGASVGLAQISISISCGVVGVGTRHHARHGSMPHIGEEAPADMPPTGRMLRCALLTDHVCRRRLDRTFGASPWQVSQLD